jgi:hypothetical protein
MRWLVVGEVTVATSRSCDGRRRWSGWRGMARERRCVHAPLRSGRRPHPRDGTRRVAHGGPGSGALLVLLGVVTHQLLAKHADEIRRYAQLLVVHGSIVPIPLSKEGIWV